MTRNGPAGSYRIQQGDQFGDLTAVRFVGNDSSGRVWEWRCKCGRAVVRRVYDVIGRHESNKPNRCRSCSRPHAGRQPHDYRADAPAVAVDRNTTAARDRDAEDCAHYPACLVEAARHNRKCVCSHAVNGLDVPCMRYEPAPETHAVADMVSSAGMLADANPGLGTGELPRAGEAKCAEPDSSWWAARKARLRARGKGVEAKP